MERAFSREKKSDKRPLEVEDDLLGKKRHGLASHLGEGDVGEVDRQLVAVEGQPLLGGNRLQLHQATAVEPGRGLPEYLSLQDSYVLTIFNNNLFNLKCSVGEVRLRQSSRIVQDVPLLMRRCAWGEVWDQADVIRNWLKVFGEPEALTELRRSLNVSKHEMTSGKNLNVSDIEQVYVRLHHQLSQWKV